MNEVIGIDIAATMERGIMEGLAEANTHSRRSLYENCCGIWVVLLCRVIRPFTVATQEDSLSQSERNKLLMEACGYDCTTALEANVLEPETTSEFPREKLLFHNRWDDEVPGHLIIPSSGRAPYPSSSHPTQVAARRNGYRERIWRLLTKA